MKDNMLEILINQYKEITGNKSLNIKDLESESIRHEFASWLYNRQKYCYRYIDFLYEICDKITERTTAEVGKTEYDSLSLPFDTTIISPYRFENLEDKSRLIPSKFLVYDESPVLYLERSNYPQVIVLPSRRIDTFMTENPYSPYSIKNWNELHNSGNYDIAVGIYGDIHDKNINNNLKMLKDLRDKIIGSDYKFDYNHNGDIYYGALVSDRKEKKLVLK